MTHKVSDRHEYLEITNVESRTRIFWFTPQATLTLGMRFKGSVNGWRKEKELTGVSPCTHLLSSLPTAYFPYGYHTVWVSHLGSPVTQSLKSFIREIV